MLTNPNRYLTTGSDERSLALKKEFSNLTVQAWQMATPMFDGSLPLIASKQVGPGEPFRFIMESLVDPNDAKFHKTGTTITGTNREFVEGTITSDQVIVTANETGIEDDTISDINYRMNLANSQVQTLKQRYEGYANRLHYSAALSAAVTKNGKTIHNGGNLVRNVAATVATRYPDSTTGADNFDTDAHILAETMTNNFVPESGRIMRITPYIARILRHRTSLFSRDFTSKNTLNSRVITEIAGFMVVVDPNIAALSSNFVDPDMSKYSIDCRVAGTNGQPVALCTAGVMEGKAPIGQAVRMGVTGSLDWETRTNTWFAKTQMFLGMDKMHVYTAGAIAVRTT